MVGPERSASVSHQRRSPPLFNLKEHVTLSILVSVFMMVGGLPVDSVREKISCSSGPEGPGCWAPSCVWTPVMPR